MILSGTLSNHWKVLTGPIQSRIDGDLREQCNAGSQFTQAATIQFHRLVLNQLQA